MNIRIDHLSSGRKNQTPQRIVIHSMAEYVVDGNKTAWHAPDFLRHIGLSVHALVSPSGEIIRCRSDNEGAYHAKGFNVNSLGVEFLVKGQHDYDSFLNQIKKDYITKLQYQAGVELVKEWIWLYNITQIDRHSDLSPERKYDPGDGFPWNQFLKDIAEA